MAGISQESGQLECPVCGSTEWRLEWCKNRMHRFRCNDCFYETEPFVPKVQKISNVKKYGSGIYTYEIYDKYGYLLISSRAYFSEDSCFEDMRKHVNIGLQDKNAGPYTGLLWPATVRVEAKVFR